MSYFFAVVENFKSTSDKTDYFDGTKETTLSTQLKTQSH